MKTDTDLLNWIEEQVKKSYTGVSFDWTERFEDDAAGFRFMRYHTLGDRKKTLRESIEWAMKNLS